MPRRAIAQPLAPAVTAARYRAIVDRAGEPAAGLVGIGGPSEAPVLVPGDGWRAFRARALGPGAIWHGPANPGLELQGQPPSPQFTSPIPLWGPDGAWALHSRFPRPGHEVLGRKFGYYSAGAAERFGQVLADTFAAGRRYCFRSAAQGGYARAGVVPYQLGYADDTGAVVVLATRAIPVDARWRQTAGVCHDTGATGPELGRRVAIQLAGAAAGGAHDIWFDDLQVVSTPLAAAP
mgnify:CR=1 FL=1